MNVIGIDMGSGDTSAFCVRQGDVIVAMGELPRGRRGDILMRLWKRTQVVDRGYETPCYEWQGPTSGKGRGGGYGRMCLNDATCAVHIVAWTNQHGFIPPRKQLDHKCNNRRCWRDEHVEMVSHRRNQKRRVERAQAKSS